MHVRKAIRDAIAELMRGTVTAGGNVFPSRLFSLDEGQLPSISVFTTDESNAETITKVTLGSASRAAMLARALPVIIEAHAVMDDDIDDTLDALAVEIETAMASPVTVAGREIPAQLVSTQTTFSADTDLQVGVLRLIYTATYSTREDAPDSLA